uniref:Uncharacterized protein LOC116944691 n=1 Tax=Petromyzon marinus TaxID=7757 RepID=A0AAJ7TAN2_PETMA|nr:uncharacterized protein LOC116944691 [Petromyzon marinus]
MVPKLTQPPSPPSSWLEEDEVNAVAGTIAFTRASGRGDGAEAAVLGTRSHKRRRESASPHDKRKKCRRNELQLLSMADTRNGRVWRDFLDSVETVAAVPAPRPDADIVRAARGRRHDSAETGGGVGETVAVKRGVGGPPSPPASPVPNDDSDEDAGARGDFSSDEEEGEFEDDYDELGDYDEDDEEEDVEALLARWIPADCARRLRALTERYHNMAAGWVAVGTAPAHPPSASRAHGAGAEAEHEPGTATPPSHAAGACVCACGDGDTGAAASGAVDGVASGLPCVNGACEANGAEASVGSECGAIIDGACDDDDDDDPACGASDSGGMSAVSSAGSSCGVDGVVWSTRGPGAVRLLFSRPLRVSDVRRWFLEPTTTTTAAGGDGGSSSSSSGSTGSYVRLSRTSSENATTRLDRGVKGGSARYHQGRQGSARALRRPRRDEGQGSPRRRPAGTRDSADDRVGKHLKKFADNEPTRRAGAVVGTGGGAVRARGGGQVAPPPTAEVATRRAVEVVAAAAARRRRRRRGEEESSRILRKYQHMRGKGLPRRGGHRHGNEEQEEGADSTRRRLRTTTTMGKVDHEEEEAAPAARGGTGSDSGGDVAANRGGDVAAVGPTEMRRTRRAPANAGVVVITGTREGLRGAETAAPKRREMPAKATEMAVPAAARGGIGGGICGDDDRQTVKLAGPAMATRHAGRNASPGGERMARTRAHGAIEEAETVRHGAPGAGLVRRCGKSGVDRGVSGGGSGGGGTKTQQGDAAKTARDAEKATKHGGGRQRGWEEPFGECEISPRRLTRKRKAEEEMLAAHAGRAVLRRGR